MNDDATGEAPVGPRLSRVLRSVIVWTLVAGAAYLLWPTGLGGCTTLTIVSGHSMEPTYHTGDVVLSRCGTPQVGDVVVRIDLHVLGNIPSKHDVINYFLSAADAILKKKIFLRK